MKPYSINKILVPVDLSEPSLNALDTAVAIAQKHDSKLVLLNIHENTFDQFADDSLSIMAGSSDVINALAGAIHHKSGLNPEVIQEEGNVSDNIIRNSFLLHSDLIVMGTHGASGYRDGYIGTNAYNVQKQAGCPVLTIPPKRKYLSFRKILFPVRPVSGALQRIDIVSNFLAGPFNLDVFGLSYRKMERETNVLEKIIEEVRDRIDFEKVSARAVWGNGISIADDVLSYAHQNNPEMIVVTSGLDVTTKPNFIGPHTQRIVNCSKVPVLVIKKIGVQALA